jgi:serine protease inhibitor ecotin
MQPEPRFTPALKALTLLLLVTAAMPATAPAADASDASRAAIKNYPASPKGYQRYVLHLDARADEAMLQIQITPRQNVPDTCGRHMRTKHETYREAIGTHYVVSNDAWARKNIACGRLKPGYVTSEPFTVDYDSNQPLVVFAPADMEIQYSILDEPKPMERNEADPSQSKTAKPGAPRSDGLVIARRGKKRK